MSTAPTIISIGSSPLRGSVPDDPIMIDCDSDEGSEYAESNYSFEELEELDEPYEVPVEEQPIVLPTSLVMARDVTPQRRAHMREGAEQAFRQAKAVLEPAFTGQQYNGTAARDSICKMLLYCLDSWEKHIYPESGRGFARQIHWLMVYPICDWVLKFTLGNVHPRDRLTIDLNTHKLQMEEELRHIFAIDAANRMSSMLKKAYSADLTVVRRRAARNRASQAGRPSVIADFEAAELRALESGHREIMEKLVREDADEVERLRREGVDLRQELICYRHQLMQQRRAARWDARKNKVHGILARFGKVGGRLANIMYPQSENTTDSAGA